MAPHAASSLQETSHQPEPSAANPSRSNEDLNLAVLRRHWPTVLSILHIASYCVVYLFNVTTQSWEKADIDGTLFIVNHVSDAEGEEKFSANILNRRRLENFAYELHAPDDIELDPKFIILKKGGEGTDMQIFGLWVFSEPPPNSTAHAHEITGHVIVEFAKRAQASRELAEVQRNGEEDLDPAGQDEKEPEEPEEPESVPMGRQLSLRELFGQQRQKDSSWSVHNHTSSQEVRPPPQSQIQPPLMSLFTSNPDTDFPQGSPPPSQEVRQPPQSQPQPSLLSLFTSNPDTDFFQSTTPSRRSPKVKSEGPAHATGSRPINLVDLFNAAGKS
jgi:hypothetical protein